MFGGRSPSRWLQSCSHDQKWRTVTRDEAAWTEIIKPMASLWLEVLNLMNVFAVTWISAGARMKIDTKEWGAAIFAMFHGCGGCSSLWLLIEPWPDRLLLQSTVLHICYILQPSYDVYTYVEVWELKFPSWADLPPCPQLRPPKCSVMSCVGTRT